MKNTHKILVIGISLAVAACSGGNEIETVKNQLKEKKEDLTTITKEIKDLETQLDSLQGNIAIDYLLVNTEKIQKQDFESFVKVHGVVTTDKNITVVPEGAGIIRSILVKRGAIVKAGQVLAYLDSDVINKNLKELETSLEFATTLYEKQKSLYDKNVGTEVQYLEAKNRKESLESSLQTLRSQKAKSVIKAPIDGKIDEIFPNVGEMASQMTPFARIVNTNNVYISSDVSEAFINNIKLGDSVNITFPYSNEKVNAKITYKSNFINMNNRTFKVNASFNSGKGNYAPNMLTVVKFRDEYIPNSIVVNSTAINTDWEGDFVYVLKPEGENYKAVKTKVTRGVSYQNKSVITEGLSDNDILITERYQSLNDGDIVKINK